MSNAIDKESGMTMNVDLTDKRIAYFVQRMEVDDKGKFIACCAVENEAGFHRMDWKWGSDYTVAQKTAASMNASMGLTKKEAARIVLSTMMRPAGK